MSPLDRLCLALLAALREAHRQAETDPAVPPETEQLLRAAAQAAELPPQP